MAIKIFNGLINLGGILTETYYRKTRASDEARQELGLDLEQEYNASIGIASVNEYITLRQRGIGVNIQYRFELAPYDQALELVSVFTGNMNTDRFNLLAYAPDDWVEYRYTVNKNLAFYPMPRIVIPKGGYITVTPQEFLGCIVLVLKPCSIISDKLQGTELVV